MHTEGWRNRSGIYGGIIIQKLSMYCKFGNYLKTELRNQFVMGVRFPRIQARLLETVDLTMESALKIAVSMEKADQGIHQLKNEKDKTVSEQVDFVGAGTKNKKKMIVKSNQNGGRQLHKKTEAKTGYSQKDKGSSKYNSQNDKSKIMCFRCGGNNLAPSCTLPRNIECKECGGFGHLKRVCKKKGQTNFVEDIATVEKPDEHTK